MATPAHSRERNVPLGGPASVVDSACPLDCPDGCSLAVTVQHGKVISLDGSHRSPTTDGFICAKVRKFGDRVYGPDRLLHPAVRKGRKGEGRFERIAWDEALELIVSHVKRATTESGAESILPVLVRRIERTDDPGQFRREVVASVGHVQAGANAVRGTDGRREHGALRQDAVGGVRRLPGGAADHLVGRESHDVRPSSRALRARGAKARRETRGDRPTLDSTGTSRRPSSGRETWYRRRSRAGHSPLSLHERLRKRDISERAHPPLGAPARAR